MIVGRQSNRKPDRFLMLAAGLAAFLLSAARINPGLTDSALPDGPGLTPDESFNIRQGVYLWDAAGQHGPLLMTPGVARRVFAEPAYLPDHPPLGRLVLGAAHEACGWLVTGAEGAPYHVAAARLGSGLALTLTAMLVFSFCRRQFDRGTALMAVSCLLLMPRVVGHSRIAALESVTSLAWFAALVPVLGRFTHSAPPRPRESLLAGCFWGLLLLTKVQAILFPPIVAVWLIARYRRSGLLPLTVWLVSGLCVWFVFWPWLWSDPVRHALEYLGRAGNRQTLYVWYLGQRFADRAVPWHYPAVMTLATLPGLVLIGCVARLCLRNWLAVDQLLLLSVAVPLAVFALPGVPVYDGARLFLVIMPGLAIVAARGWMLLLLRLRGCPSGKAAVVSVGGRLAVRVLVGGAIGAAVVTLPAAIVDVCSPFALSRYGIAVGGQRGAAWLQLESSYWADGLNADFWRQVPAGSDVFVAPVSHEFQLTDLEALVPIIRDRRIKLRAFEYDSRQQRGFLLLIHRLADLRPSLQSAPAGSVVVAEARSGGRLLAQLVDTTHATWEERP